MSLSEQSLDAARARTKAAAQPRRTSATPYSGTGYAYKNYDELRYYAAFREQVYTAARPIATRFAGQALRMAAIPKRMGNRETATLNTTKALRDEGYIAGGDDATFTRRQKMMRAMMPHRVKSALPENAVVLDDHVFLDTMNRPNDIMDGWSTMYCVAASLLTCGKSLLLWDDNNLSVGGGGELTSSVYYTPMHWATPMHDDQPFSGWNIRPTTGSNSYPVKRGEFVYFQMPNPGDPMNGLSPVMATSRTINTNDKISDAHQSSMENLISPSYAIVMGDVTDGSGQRRAKVDKAGRRDIVNAIKSYVGGALRAGEPIVLDALIDDLRDISPKTNDLSFVNGSQLMTDKIMQAMGVSPIIAGFSQNANRAGSVTAHDIFYDVVLNPLLLLSGGAFTHFIGPRFNTDAYRIVIYHDEARIEDSDQKRARAATFKEAFNTVEKRKYVRTGDIDWTDEDVPEVTPGESSEPVGQN